MIIRFGFSFESFFSLQEWRRTVEFISTQPSTVNQGKNLVLSKELIM